MAAQSTGTEKNSLNLAKVQAMLIWRQLASQLSYNGQLNVQTLKRLTPEAYEVKTQNMMQ